MTPDEEKAVPAPQHGHAPPDMSMSDDGTSYSADHVDDSSSSKPKKKRKVIKTADKKYMCPADDCGKSYSRAEHLYRHQLNHTPKQIYRCDFPGCERHFVRADLCARHKERHTAKGSHLQRKDAFLNSQRAAAAAIDEKSHMHTANGHAQAGPVRPHDTAIIPDYTSARRASLSTSHGSNDRYQGPPGSEMPRSAMHASACMAAGYTSYSTTSQSMTSTSEVDSPDRRFPYDHAYGRHNIPQYNVPQGIAMNPASQALTSPPTNPMYPQQSYPSPSISSLRSGSYSEIPPFAALSYQSQYGPPRSNNTMSPSGMLGNTSHQMPHSVPMNIGDFPTMDSMAFGYAMPVFGADGFHRSPSIIMDESFLNSLFNTSGAEMMNTTTPPPQEPQSDTAAYDMAVPKVESVETLQYQTGETRPGSQGVPTLDGSDINERENVITERKQHRLASLVNGWSNIESNPGRRAKDDILRGDMAHPEHPLSSQMLKEYISSYWSNIHCQMPILHRPTFNPETCPDLLLLAMTCFGATTLTRDHSDGVVDRCAELAFFMAHHIRWEVFKDAEFRPTAKLWTFQTMLLLELFEKMYSTRPLHERAHIHHATTLTVMRRGSSLIGRSAGDAPHHASDPTRTPPGPDGTINASGQNTADAFWNRWITAEATRRVAFAAFIIDSTHATLFGHAAVMSPHDLRLSLPCDEALWSATSSAEVQRVEASLAANGFKPTSFLEGLKKTLNGQKVRTNTFGRVILMSGLLNVSWHMNQRDLQVSSLGAATTLGNQIRWRSPLTRAFDHWRRDFDESLTKNDFWLHGCNHKSTAGDGLHHHRDHVSESRTCLHSLAHMAMHVDITDCLVFAGSDHVLGRTVTEADRLVVQRRMREQWAPTARARDAAFYALRFLSEVLIPDEELASRDAQRSPVFTYLARDDFLLNRPWALYFATLIVWSYGYALDGPLGSDNNNLTTHERQIMDMQSFLIKMGGVASPDDLEKLLDRNACLGLLLLVRRCFEQSRWELLQDARDVLGSCINLLLPGHPREPQAGKHLTGV